MPDSYIMHYDINAMYTYVMAEDSVHYDDFQYLDQEEIKTFNAWDHDKDRQFGYILYIDVSEIDILYHNYYNDIPPFPTNTKI